MLKCCTIFLVVLSVFNPVFSQDKLITIDDLYDPEDKVSFSGKSVRGLRWMKDSTHLFKSSEDGGYEKIDAFTGGSQPLFVTEYLEKAFSKLTGFSEKDAKNAIKKGRLTLSDDESGILISYSNDLFFYRLDSKTLTRMTQDSKSEEATAISPSGEWTAFVKEFDLQVVETATGLQKRLTFDGCEDIRNGYLDWVYQEEIYGRNNFKAYWWSPDSQHIAFLQLDDREVPNFTIIDHVPTHLNLEVNRYPKSGDPNPKVRLGIVAINSGEIQWVDLYKYSAGEFLIVRVDWSPDSREVVFQVQDREQTWLDLNSADVAKGKLKTILREESEAWINVLGDPYWLKDGSFLWRSERTGFRHLYHYSKDGELLNTVTSGEWELRKLESVDEENDTIFFSGTKDTVIGSQLYRVGLDGGGITRISERAGSHSINFSPDSKHYVDSWSEIMTPTQVRLHSMDGSEVRIIEENRVEVLAEYQLSRPEFLQVNTRDGFVMEAMMIKPPDFDPAKKYPVMSYTYSGPHAQSVRNRFGGTTLMWHQMLAQNGYIIWVCDNRSSSGKGVQSAWKAYRRLGESELQDLEDGLNWLKSQPYVDGSRIGLWGWSYGGFMTSYALTHSQSFKVGIAGAPVTDWSLYDSIYTERYMAMPQNNPDGYKETSAVNAAADLHGKLLLIHGMIDDNVHMQNTVRFVEALQKAGKDFQLMVYPKSRHGVRNPKQVKHLRTMMTNFILDNL